SRSTEDGMTYMPNVDRLIVVGGTRACHVGGRGTQSIWTFDFDTKTWREMQPSGPLPARSFTIATAYDPNTGRVFIYDGASLYAYDFIQNRMQKLSAKQERADEVSGVIDPVRKQFLVIGSGKVVVYAIGPNSTYTPQVIQTVGGDSVVNALRPGLAYASGVSKIVGWSSGDTVYTLDQDTNVWTPMSFPGGPTTPAFITSKVFSKRWSYIPNMDSFVVLTSMDHNAFALRLGTPPHKPLTLSGSAPSGTLPAGASQTTL